MMVAKESIAFQLCAFCLISSKHYMAIEINARVIRQCSDSDCLPDMASVSLSPCSDITVVPVIR